MKESNRHKLEKNQNRHHFGQLPWSLKNPDGTHLALGRGWNRKEALERKYPSWNTCEEGKDKQSEQQLASGQGSTAHTFLQRSHMASHQTPGAGWTGHFTTPQHSAASHPPLQSKQNSHPACSDRKELL